MKWVTFFWLDLFQWLPKRFHINNQRHSSFRYFLSWNIVFSQSSIILRISNRFAVFYALCIVGPSILANPFQSYFLQSELWLVHHVLMYTISMSILCVSWEELSFIGIKSEYCVNVLDHSKLACCCIKHRKVLVVLMCQGSTRVDS